MDVVGLLTTIISGGVGGNVAGMLMKEKSLGTLWNTIVGVVGGGLGSQLLGLLGVAAGSGGLDLGSIASSLVGGGGLMVIVSLVKQMLNKSKQPA
jgi:uncharacterized membrane protein YeaQ/YmgE (transglycosylase-associated protein family)